MYIITNTDQYFHNTLLIKRDIKIYMCPLSLDLTPKNVNKKYYSILFFFNFRGFSNRPSQLYSLFFIKHELMYPLHLMWKEKG